MTKELYSVGWLFNQNEIEKDIKEGIEKLTIDLNNNKYIKFENITFSRVKNATDSSTIKEVILTQKSILTKIYGDIVEYSQNGKRRVLISNCLIGHVPQLLEGRNTYIVNGTEYNIVNQLRRNASSYVTIDNNNNVYADFNLSKGRNFNITLDNLTNIFYIEIGTSKILLKPLLDALDITEKELKETIGEQLTRINYTDVPDNDLSKAYAKLYKRLYEFRGEDVSQLPIEYIKKEVKKYFKENTQVDPRTSFYLYGHESKTVDKQLILSTLKKFVKVIKNEEEPNDIDDLYYQKLYPPNLLFKDRLEKLSPEIINKVKFKLNKKEVNYENVFKNLFSKPLISMVNSSNLSRLDPQYNPLGMYSTVNTVTPLGMGGINEIEAVRKNARGVHNSHLGVIDPIASPQGLNVGVQLKLTKDIKVDKEGHIYLPLKKNKRGAKKEYMSLQDIYNKKVLLPGQEKSNKVDVLYKGQIIKDKYENVDYVFSDDTDNILNDLNKLIPFSNAVQGNRNFMSYRFLTQALPLLHREKILVEPITNKGISAYKEIREQMSSLIPFKSPVDGEVKKIKEGIIYIEDKNGKTHEVHYHKHLPFATNTGVHQRPIVSPGDKVKKGDIILTDPYTDKEGNLAPGVNLRVAYTPYYGKNSEDAVVISESASKKLTSIHYYSFSATIDENNILNKKLFFNYFSKKYKDDQIQKLDNDGIIKLNSYVSYGDPLITIIKRITPDDKLTELGKISKDIVIDIKDGSVLYNKDTPGEVIDIKRTGKIVTVIVKTFERAKVGDKISNLYGGKGIISDIIPDDKILRTKDGKPIDVIWSSSVVVSRINPAQIFENALGKIVDSGKTDSYKIPILKNPDNKPIWKFVKEELKKYNIKDKEIVFDPIANKHIENPIAVGKMYTLKLLKSDKELTARGVGPYYTSNLEPTKGGSEGAKSIGMAEFYALVAHNARKNLTEFANIKSQYNPEFWKNFELGLPYYSKNSSFPFEKLKAYLTSAGAVVKQTDSAHQLIPLTDKITNELAQHRVIKTPALIKAKSLEPVKQGLFDKNIIGGLDGKLWSKIELEDGIISPIVSDYVRLLLNMSQEEFEQWQASSSTKEMKDALSKIDVNKLLEELKTKSKFKNGLNNNEVKIYKFLSNLKEKKISLPELVITAIPVPPPIMRPITKLENGNIQLSDINLFYKDVMIANEGLKNLMNSKEFKPEAKKVLIDTIDALIGKKETKNLQLKRKGAKGLLSYIGGIGSPKNGFIHSVLIKKNQDMSGRARIIPDAKMDMNTIGIPEQMAWKIFEPHLRKSLFSSGYTVTDVEKMIREKDPVARKHLFDIADKLYVAYNRAPTLHKGSFLAAKPKIVPGNSIVINMFATGPLNADFDGDAIQIHVPVSPEASKEMSKFTLSKLLLTDADIDRLGIKFMVESIIGLYQMSLRDKNKVKKEITEIYGKEVPIDFPLTKKNINKLLIFTAKEFPDKASDIFLKLKLLGDKYATEIGSTVGVDDVTPEEEKIIPVIKKYKLLFENAKSQEQRLKIADDFQKKMMELAEKHPGDLSLLVASGAKGTSNQLSSIITSPAVSYDPDRIANTINITTGNFSSGLNIREFWEQNAKARKDLVNTALSVSVPGMINKLMLAATNKEVITTYDCGTKNGIEIDRDSPDILGRVLQEDIGKMKRGTIITSQNRNNLPKKKILVRSPRTCEALEGVCQLCYGVDSYGNFYDIGTNVGVITSQELSEPLAQLSLDSKHGGRSIIRDISKSGLNEITKLFSGDENKPGVAVIADEDGVVDEIEELPSGIKLIKMEDGVKYKVSRNSEIIVKIGDKVNKGDKLTSGILPFTKIIELKGIQAGREALTNELYKVLSENNLRIHSRLPEILSKSVVNYIEMLTPFYTFHIGDVVPYNKFVGVAKKHGIQVNTNNLVPGNILAEEVSDLSAGHTLTESDIKKIKRERDTVLILPIDVKVKPVIKSLYTAGLSDEDWLNQFGSRYIKKTIIKATGEGDQSEISSLSPMSKWISGGTFSTKGPTY